jgi:hypothetical protein
MGMSPTTERIVPLNPRINLGKYEDPCQVGDLNPDGQIPPQRTQQTGAMLSSRLFWSTATKLRY